MIVCYVLAAIIFYYSYGYHHSVGNSSGWVDIISDARAEIPLRDVASFIGYLTSGHGGVKMSSSVSLQKLESFIEEAKPSLAFESDDRSTNLLTTSTNNGLTSGADLGRYTEDNVAFENNNSSLCGDGSGSGSTDNSSSSSGECSSGTSSSGSIRCTARRTSNLNKIS